MRRPLAAAVVAAGPRGTQPGSAWRVSPWLRAGARGAPPAAVIDHPAATMFTGLLLVLLGILLALPIPLTNYLFGLLLLAFALAWWSATAR